MSRVCTICSHSKLLNIDRDILRGDALSAVARRFRVSPDAVGRHREHMRTAMLKAQAVAEKTELVYGQTLIEEMRAIRNDVERLQSAAESRRDFRAALLAIRERLALAELWAKLSGQVDGKQKNELHLHFPPDRALAIAQAYVTRHAPEKVIPELQGLPPSTDAEEKQ